MKLNIFFIFLFISLASCSQKYGTDKKDPGNILLMTYNVENLFDTIHDEGKDDYTYLPLTEKNRPEVRAACERMKLSHWKEECLTLDWSESVLEEKMQRLADVILQLNDGEGPDLVFVQEVENHRVLQMFTDRHLKAKGFREVVLLEGKDERGVDTGIISKLPLHGKPQIHHIGDTEKEQATRGLLQAEFVLPDGSILTAFSVHLPSQHNPTPMRVKGLEALNRARAKLPEDRIVIAAGDFNITNEEDQKNNLLRDHMMPYWYISHYIGCGDCTGTHSFRGSWSFLDIMFFSKNLGPKGNANWEIEPKSILIPKNNRHQVSRFNTPERFGGGKSAGVSDHFPLAATLKRRNTKPTE